MTTPIKYWQWPNLLAIDAALIAAAWLWVFNDLQAGHIKVASYLVLALSVWLTYVADRLFDVARRSRSELLSHRHQFAKQYGRLLWLVWMLVLLFNIRLALSSLSEGQLERGWVLLIVCLAYTSLNQLLAKRFFPKELLVALIFTGGTQVFLPELSGSITVLAFALSCLANCLIIANREKVIDNQLKLRSLGSLLPVYCLNGLFAISLTVCLFSEERALFIPTLIFLALLHLRRNHVEAERFRVLSDLALLIGPLSYFFISSGVCFR
ncbi:MAG: hypothetical protein ACPGIC_06540 [Opitutales bacterium]